MNKFNPEIPPAWHVIKLDETCFYDKSFLDQYGVEKIYGVYIVDFSKRVYCCEITPSYELNFVKSIYEGGPDVEDEEAIEAFECHLYDCDAVTESVSYMHCGSIHSLPEDCKVPIQIQDSDWDDSDDGFNAAYEECVSNPVW